MGTSAAPYTYREEGREGRKEEGERRLKERSEGEGERWGTGERGDTEREGE
jgi:hypothetical protein